MDEPKVERALKARNGNPLNPELPPDALELLNDPRLEGMTDAPKNFPRATRVLKPAEIVRTESSYLLLDKSYVAQPGQRAAWVNAPQQYYNAGHGLGFDQVTDRPRIEDPGKSPKRLFHFWPWSGHFVASPDMLDLLSRQDATDIAALPIDWVFSDGQALDGYVFVDFIRLHHAYDYRRSVVNVEMHQGRKWPALGYERALREDIPASTRIFRDALYRSDAFVSRTFAPEMAALASREISFKDVHRHWPVKFPPPSGRRKLQARLKPAEVAVQSDSLLFRVIPLLESGSIAAAEAILAGLLRELPATPYHVIDELQVTTTPQACAEFFDAFCEKAQREHALEAVYTEMNAFTVNPDLWFCDAFGYSRHGGSDGYDWLSEMSSESDERFVISGLEPLQAVFAASMAGARPPEHQAARYLATCIVIVKFQRLLQQALPHMKKLKCPLLASAHEYTDFVVEIRPS